VAQLVPGVIWIYDFAHFAGLAGWCAIAVIDVVSRKWLSTVVSAEETSTQVEVAFTRALVADGKQHVSTFYARGSIFVASACTKFTLCRSNVGPIGTETSRAVRFPNGIQMNDGLNVNRLDFDTTVTSTSVPSSRFRLSAAVTPAKFPPERASWAPCVTSSHPPRRTRAGTVSRCYPGVSQTRH
jgi:hypothetical protein